MTLRAILLVSASTLEKDLSDIKVNVEGGAKLGKVVGERMKAANISYDRIRQKTVICTMVLSKHSPTLPENLAFSF